MNKAILQTNVGTPIQVLVLPTPSASLTGLVYHLISDDKYYVVANGEWKVLSVDDYNMLKNLPIINQDLTSTDFAIVEGNYYRHIGSTNDTLVNGTIYRYQNGILTSLATNNDIQSLVGNINTLLESIDTGAGV